VTQTYRSVTVFTVRRENSPLSPIVSSLAPFVISVTASPRRGALLEFRATRRMGDLALKLFRACIAVISSTRPSRLNAVSQYRCTGRLRYRVLFDNTRVRNDGRDVCATRSRRRMQELAIGQSYR